MREIVLMSFVMLSICTSSFAQDEYSTEYEVRYDVEFSINSLDLEERKKETVYLFTGRNHGVFLNHNEANKEAISEAIDRMHSSGGFDLEKSGFRNTDFNKNIYKNFSDNKVEVRMLIVEESFVYTEPNVPLAWEMFQESKEFMGYTVQKATTSFAGCDYEAWFTLEIPIPDGPYVFYGLPGLIVELYDTENHYHFTLKSLSKLQEERAWESPDGKRIDKTMKAELLSKELDAKIAFTMDLFNSEDVQVSMEALDINTTRIRRRIIEDAKKKGNRIERE